MRPIATWCVRHRRAVLAMWLIALVGLIAATSNLGTDYRNSFSLHSTQSFQAEQLLERTAPEAAGDREQVVVAVSRGHLSDQATKTRVQAMLARVASLPTVASVQSPYAPRGADQVSRDGRVAFATVTMSGPDTNFTDRQARQFVHTATSASGHGLQVAVDGSVAEASNPSTDNSVVLGAGAALIVLLVMFSSFLAAMLPLVTAGVALGVGTSVIGLLSHLITMADFSEQLSLLIGLGVGVDYALFIVSRFRQGLRRGKPVEEAIVDAVDTSGRAVMFAGVTVCIALLGMFALGVSLLYGVAIAAAIVVSFTVLAALTLLPALLGMLGARVLGRRGRRRLKRIPFRAPETQGLWAAWSRLLERRTLLVAIAGVLAMAVLAGPALNLRLGSTDAGSNPRSTTTRQAYDLLAQGFGQGFNGPLLVVAEVADSPQRDAFGTVLTAAKHTAGVAGVTPMTLSAAPGGSPSVASAEIFPTGSPQAESTSVLLTHLRDQVVPDATAGTGARVLIGGQTAVFADFASVLSTKLPLFIAVVVGLSFLLLAVVFRSIVIPLMAAAMNMLSSAAAFGVLVAVFQYGWGASLLGVTGTGPIEAFIPVMMFAILFGLSMDYEVFLVARIYEEWHRTGDNRLAVMRGLAATGRTITAAATIMVLVFASFMFGDMLVIKMFGVGLAAAVLLDAVVVRMAIVPSLMLLIGRVNWRIPRLLDGILPHLNVEGSVKHAPITAPVLEDPSEEPVEDPVGAPVAEPEAVAV